MKVMWFVKAVARSLVYAVLSASLIAVMVYLLWYLQYGRTG